MQIQQIAISRGTYSGEGSNRKPVVEVYTPYLAMNNGCSKAFTVSTGDLLLHMDAQLCLRSSSDSSVLRTSVNEIFLAPRADFFPRPDLTIAVSGDRRIYYGNGRGAVLEELIKNGRLIAQPEAPNPIMNILMEGLSLPNGPNSIEQLNNIRNIIDYVFSKPHLLLSVLLILRNEADDQHLFADAGNVPHRNQLILNMSPERTSFIDKLHSGTQFGIASYYHYDRQIYKSVLNLDVADYVITSISYYPQVLHSNINHNSIYNSIRNYYDSLLGDYRYSVYSFHLWRHSLYGGFSGVVRGSRYASEGYTLRPECACKALKLQIDAQTQQEFKKGWYAVLHFPTAFYILLLYLAIEKPNSQHDSKTINEALNKLQNIKEDKNSSFYKRVIKRFTDEIGEDFFYESLRRGINDIIAIKRAVERSKYQNPIQMLWNFCKEYIVIKTHNAIINRLQRYSNPNDQNATRKINATKNRINLITEYINNKFNSISSMNNEFNSISSLYNLILEKEKQFFDS